MLSPLRTLTNEAARTSDLPKHRGARALSLDVNGAICRSEGIDIASDVVNVKGQDSVTLG